jgi:hypothetical protein
MLCLASCFRMSFSFLPPSDSCFPLAFGLDPAAAGLVWAFGLGFGAGFSPSQSIWFSPDSRAVWVGHQLRSSFPLRLAALGRFHLSCPKLQLFPRQSHGSPTQRAGWFLFLQIFVRFLGFPARESTAPAWFPFLIHRQKRLLLSPGVSLPARLDSIWLPPAICPAARLKSRSLLSFFATEYSPLASFFWLSCRCSLPSFRRERFPAPAALASRIPRPGVTLQARFFVRPAARFCGLLRVQVHHSECQETGLLLSRWIKGLSFLDFYSIFMVALWSHIHEVFNEICVRPWDDLSICFCCGNLACGLVCIMVHFRCNFRLPNPVSRTNSFYIAIWSWPR